MRWIGGLFLALAGAVLGLRWDRLPARWAVHWGSGDRPDRWVDKSVPAALAPLIFGAVLWLLVVGLGAAGLRNAKLPREVMTAQRQLLDGVGVTAALAASFCAVALPMQPRSSFPLVLGTALPLLVAIAVGLRRLRAATAAARARGAPGLEGWDGVVYRNATDPRLWVPKLSGLGWTVNFAHRRARLVLAALVLGPILAAVGVAVAVVVKR